jgi:hypothetical protein
LVEVARKSYLASIVPVIVNAILNEHQIVVDIVAFVNKGDFPRSRLGEKQRGKILAGWVSRKLRTMAQFSIKDNNREPFGAPAPAGGEQASTHGGPALDDPHRASLGSFRSSSGGPLPGHGGGANSSLRNVEPAPQIPEHQQQMYHHHHQAGYDDRAMTMNSMHHAPGGGTVTPGPVEMPADDHQIGGVVPFDNDQTPTRGGYAQHQQQQPPPSRGGGGSILAEPALHGFELPDFEQFVGHDEPPPPGSSSGPGPAGSGIGMAMSSQSQSQSPPPQIRLPGVDGRESLDDWDLRPGSGGHGGLGGEAGRGPRGGAGAGGAGAAGGEEDDWRADAYMSMNLAGTLGGK